MIKNLLLALAALLISSCGWQLRDAQIVPENLGSLHLSAKDPHSALIKELTRSLNLYGVEVVASAADARYSVVIVDFRRTRRTSTINSSARVAEYQLNEDVDFLIVSADGSQLIPLSTASVERVYEFNEQDVLSSDNEERLVKNAMREEIVRQILNRLRLLPPEAEPLSNDQAAAAQTVQTLQ
jgi:LPS-assembly lipoprotein